MRLTLPESSWRLHKQSITPQGYARQINSLNEQPDKRSGWTANSTKWQLARQVSAEERVVSQLGINQRLMSVCSNTVTLNQASIDWYWGWQYFIQSANSVNSKRNINSDAIVINYYKWWYFLWKMWISYKSRRINFNIKHTFN